MLSPFKTLLRRLVKSAGYDMVNRRTFGNDIMRDIITLLHGRDKLTVLDIGANEGNLSVEVAASFSNAHIYSIEPDPATFKTLKEKTKAYPNIQVFNVGFGDKAETRLLHINKHSGGNSFLEVSPSIKAYEGDWAVPVNTVDANITTLDSFCAGHHIDFIDMAKIDTQGYEIMILNGGREMIHPSKTRLIYIEVLFVELYKKQAFFVDIFSELEKRGFKLIGFYNRFYSENRPHNLLWCDALFGSATLIEDMKISTASLSQGT